MEQDTICSSTDLLSINCQSTMLAQEQSCHVGTFLVGGLWLARKPQLTKCGTLKSVKINPGPHFLLLESANLSTAQKINALSVSDWEDERRWEWDSNHRDFSLPLAAAVTFPFDKLNDKCAACVAVCYRFCRSSCRKNTDQCCSELLHQTSPPDGFEFFNRFDSALIWLYAHLVYESLK